MGAKIGFDHDGIPVSWVSVEIQPALEGTIVRQADGGFFPRPPANKEWQDCPHGLHVQVNKALETEAQRSRVEAATAAAVKTTT
jgi:hypothetical protein